MKIDDGATLREIKSKKIWMAIIQSQIQWNLAGQ